MKDKTNIKFTTVVKPKIPSYDVTKKDAIKYANLYQSWSKTESFSTEKKMRDLLKKHNKNQQFGYSVKDEFKKRGIK